MRTDLERQIFDALLNDSGPNLSASQLTEKLGCTFDEAHSAAVALGQKTMRDRRTVMVYNERDKNERIVDFKPDKSAGKAPWHTDITGTTA